MRGGGVPDGAFARCASAATRPMARVVSAWLPPSAEWRSDFLPLCRSGRRSSLTVIELWYQLSRQCYKFSHLSIESFARSPRIVRWLRLRGCRATLSLAAFLHPQNPLRCGEILDAQGAKFQHITLIKKEKFETHYGNPVAICQSWRAWPDSSGASDDQALASVDTDQFI